MADTASLLQLLLAFVWAPVLIGAGVLDWALHRAQRIEHSAGLRESLLHLVMLACVGSAILAALLLEPTAGLLLLLIALLLAHEAAYLADLRVALARRAIPALEQWVHGFQHLLPWAGLAAWAALSPDQALALVQAPGHVADWSIRPKAGPLPWGTLLPLVAVSGLLNVLPFVEESWRAARARARGAGDAPAHPPPGARHGRP